MILRRLGPALALLFCAAAAAPQPWRWALPAGVAQPPVPPDNPMSAARVELGRRLFYEADLSRDGTMACATCHEQRRGFADGNRTHAGVTGEPGRRNVPGLANVAWARTLTWADPRLTTLEAQVAVPVRGEHPVEMGMKGQEGEMARRLAADSCYRRMFRKAFPSESGRIDMGTISAALAAFERTLIARNAPWDRFLRGESGAMPAAARAGAALFTVHCASCHDGPDLGDGAWRTLDPASHGADRGLAEVTGIAADAYRFRTPGLRNIALTAPYLHDGSAPDLPAAIRRHGPSVPAASAFSRAEMADLLAFLDQLTDEGFIRDPALSLPMRACGKRL
ncbi:cytochrome-c peroxidase [Flavisphingomonas formosensis]|uniref:cytochrome-c peroxidase n=1 Tax=Flavisphingomonas formosensis TaxID=861534 RepID=UPI0012FB9BFE|nr:cytochrome c peroxidase [Sphingomonas formosensis]